MAFKNFIPNLWAAGINTELKRKMVFAEDCNTKYSGTAKKRGESVTILGVGRPTITTISKANGERKLGTPEIIEDTSVIMYINQLSWFNYAVDDIDAAQANENFDGTLKSETSEVLADTIDKHIASVAVDESVPRAYTTGPITVSAKEGVEGTIYVLDAMDLAMQKLMENDVPDSAYVVATVTPRFYNIFKKAYRFEDTNNSGILKNGQVGMYGRVTVKVSNNVYQKDGVDYIAVRTARAVAFAKTNTHVEADRDKDWFTDVIRGYVLYQAKVVRPKEAVVIEVKYAS